MGRARKFRTDSWKNCGHHKWVYQAVLNNIKIAWYLCGLLRTCSTSKNEKDEYRFMWAHDVWNVPLSLLHESSFQDMWVGIWWKPPERPKGLNPESSSLCISYEINIGFNVHSLLHSLVSWEGIKQLSWSWWVLNDPRSPWADVLISCFEYPHFYYILMCNYIAHLKEQRFMRETWGWKLLCIFLPQTRKHLYVLSFSGSAKVFLFCDCN